MTRVVTRSMSSLKRFEVCWPRSADSMVPLLPAARAPAVNHNRSAVAPGDVVLGRLLRGVREELAGVVELDQFPEVHEGRVVGHARGLLHVVRDDDHGHLVAQLR